MKQTMLSLAEEFRRYIPDDENGYLAHSEVHSRFNEKELEITILEEAVAKLPRASKSLLRRADIYYIQGRVEEALKIYDSLKRAKKSLDHSFNLQNEWKFLVNMLEVKVKIEYPYY